MKKIVRTLTLHRETLRDLGAQAASLVEGGAFTARCEFSGRNTCGTCVFTCTTNYC